MFRKMDFGGNPYIGVYAFCTEEVLVLPLTLPMKQVSSIEEVLCPSRTITTSIGSSVVVGSLLSGNSNGLVLTSFARKDELDRFHGLNVYVIESKLNATGNTILANDKGCLVHPGYDDQTIRKIEQCLQVGAVRGTIGGIRTVGSSGLATNKGVLCHPSATEKELSLAREALGVPAAIGSANYGVGQVGACMLANTKGAIVGTRTTPIEIGRIENALFP